MKVGFIGLGVMGRPMARHLQAAGHELHVWSRRPGSTDGLDAMVHATPAALGAACEVVFTMITSSADVEGVALGADGLVRADTSVEKLGKLRAAFRKASLACGGSHR